MLDNGLSADQVRSAAGVTFAEAQVATYMASAAADGWTLARLAESTRLPAKECRSRAFKWGIPFTDYDPFAKPIRLDWRKAKPGWVLIHDGKEVGSCLRQSDGRYRVSAFDIAIANWDSRRAMSQLAEELDLRSSELFDGRPVLAVIATNTGMVSEVLFPIEDKQVQKCRDALQARTMLKCGGQWA